MRLRRAAPSLAALGVLAVCVLIYHRSVAFSSLVPVGYDIFTYFYPNETFAAQSLSQGHLPLWNPYLFAGVPFLANSQTAVLYPPNLLFQVLSVPRAYVTSALLHLFLASASMYAFARLALGVDRLGGLAAGGAFAFGGFAAGLYGHLNQLQVVAWAPLVLTLFHLAYFKRSLRWAVGAAACIALQALAGHSQELYLTLILLGLYFLLLTGRNWSAGEANDPVMRASGPRRWIHYHVPLLGLLAFVVILGAGLAAAQLVPSLELSSLSVRSGGLTFDEAQSFSLPPWELPMALLPVFGEEPVFSEWMGYVGLTGLLLAGWAAVRQPRRPEVLFFLAVAVVSLLLALGAATPLFAAVYKVLPGARLFRVPARWLFLYTFALSSLLAMGLSRLGSVSLPKVGWGRRLWLLVLPVGGLALGVAYWALGLSPELELPNSPSLVAWAGIGVAVLALIWLSDSRRRRWSAYGCAVMLLAELLAAGSSMEASRPTLPEAASSLRPSVAYLKAQNGVFRVLAATENTFDPGDLSSMRGMIGGVLSERQAYDYAVAQKLKETLAPNLPLEYGIASLDGYDGGLLPLRSYVEMKRLFELTGEKSADARFREQLTQVPSSSLAAWLNVKYFLMDRVRDLWVDGIYYDLGMRRPVSSSQELVIAGLSPMAATSIGLISFWSGTLPSDGATVAVVSLIDAVGRVNEVPVIYGLDTRIADCAVEASEGRAARVIGLARDGPSVGLYLGKLQLKDPIPPSRITVRAVVPGGVLDLRSLSLIDDRLGTSEAVAIDENWRLVYLGDVKIYENRGVLPRAFLAGNVELVAQREDALDRLASSGFKPLGAAVVQAGDWLGTGHSLSQFEGNDKLASVGSVDILSYEPERVQLRVKAEKPAVLVLTDTYYPGWKTLLDGVEVREFPANYMFRGVVVPAGTHEVQFLYQPSSLTLGAACSGLAILAAVATLAWPWLHGLRPPRVLTRRRHGQHGRACD